MTTPTSTHPPRDTTTPQRHIPLQGCSNFRDLGGYIGHQGRALRWGKVFRADHLADLQVQDWTQLNALGLARAVDLRGHTERQRQGYDWPQLEQHHLAIEPTLVQEAIALLQAGGQLSVPDTVALMQDTYRSFVRDYTPMFARLLALLLEDERPLVFHCTAGKDRTGWAAALLLHALGVQRAHIEHDYLLTNQFYRRPAALAEQAAQHAPAEVLQVLWAVQLPFLHSAYALVDAEYGGLDTYLREVLGLRADALAQLRARYLQPAA